MTNTPTAQEECHRTTSSTRKVTSGHGMGIVLVGGVEHMILLMGTTASHLHSCLLWLAAASNCFVKTREEEFVGLE